MRLFRIDALKLTKVKKIILTANHTDNVSTLEGSVSLLSLHKTVSEHPSVFAIIYYYRNISTLTVISDDH